MNRFFIGFLKSIVVGLILLTCFSTSALAIEEGKIVRIGVYDNKPKIFRLDSGKVSGFFADILDFIAIQENWKIDYVFGTFDEGLDRLENGGIDIMVDVAYSEDRAARFDFTNETVLGSWGVVYVRKVSDIESFSDLDRKKIGILKSSVYLEGEQGLKAYVKSFGIKVDFVEVDQYTDIFTLLEKGDVDAAVVSRIFGVTNEKDHPLIRATNIFFSPTELRFALHKGNPDNPYYIEKIDYWLSQIKEGYENFYRDSLEKYGLLGMAPEREVVPGWLWVAVSVIVGLLLLSLLINLLLKRARELTKRELQQRESMLGTVVENTPMFISSANPEGIITMFAGQGTGLAKYLPKNVIGKSIFEVFKDNRTVIDNFQRAAAGEAVIFKAEVAKRVWMIHITPLMDNGKVHSLIGIAFDYSGEDMIEKEKTEFIYLVSHHLRTNPTEIKWNLKLLEPKIKDKLSKADIALWDGISQANDAIIDLANTLSLCSWLELTTFKADYEEFSVPDLVNEEVKKHHSLTNRKNLNLSLDFHQIDKMYSDKKKLATVINTLITNAIIYNREKGDVRVEVKEVQDDYLISVQDSGLGIPENEHRKIFTRFYRASNIVKQYPYGIGLSLYMAKLIVEKLGGKIWFESNDGKGCTFFVKLPKLSKLV